MAISRGMFKFNIVCLNLLPLLLLTSSCICVVFVHGSPNYQEALSKAILFFEGQRSGKIQPATAQRINWRSSSGLHDGAMANVDLIGGYYDAGDNVKFGFPMAFTATMISWSILEYGGRMGATEVKNARTSLKWATDYLLKAATATQGKLYVGVGDPNADHSCWERPEDMDTSRNVYSVSPTNPGSDVAGETAAALAAASLVFKNVYPSYSASLLSTAKKLMSFADKYRGAYSDSLGSAVCPFYCSYSGYKDELLWGAAWLLRATNNISYLNYINSLGANDFADIFSWDNKYAGARVLLSRQFFVGKYQKYQPFTSASEKFICSILPQSPTKTTRYTPGGLMYKIEGSNLQYVASISFLLSTYAKYMAGSNHTFTCTNLLVTPKLLRNFVKSQVDYILGVNPLSMSYMVGYGSKFPRHIHHRGSSMPSIKAHPQVISCKDGFTWFNTPNPNPNILTGAVVGGPDQNDKFPDNRGDYARSEPATYINAALLGPLAYFANLKV